MKAVLFHNHGGPEVLEYSDYPTPDPMPGHVQVRLRAAALNRADLWVREGWPGLKLDYPHIPGADGAGEVSSLGEGVSDLKIGDRVVINSSISCGACSLCLDGMDNLCRDWHLLGETIRGTYAEYVVIPAINLLPLPDTMDYEEAAAASLVFHTAWHSLITRGRLEADESVLVIGASGGVNTASIQVAKYIGAKVYVVGSSPEKLALAESLGADVLIDRSQEDNWSKAVFLATERQGVDVVVDNVGAGTMPLSLRTTRKGGRILTVGNTGGAKFEIDNRYIFGKHLSVLGSTMGTHTDFATVMELIFDGKLKPVIDRQYPLKEAAAAQERLAAGEQMGKITLAI
ncbi:MAG: zinc-binding dehydrogenase [Anaerolineaceae bacterium]|nr:MAG: zinc-binding dehydrogenase [Anaerolineaceae bacterium]